jgi:N-acetylglucosaminyldiphosphoundecaprenol N-acetyl-beta-D-mannosaminyltransferase
MDKVIDFAGIKVDNVNMAEAVEIVRHLIVARSPSLIVTPNPEIIVAAQQDEEFKQIINGAVLRVPDGASLVVVSRLLGCPLKERVSGIDLMTELIKASAENGYRVFLFGGAPGIAMTAADKLIKLYPKLNIAGTLHGYLSDDSGIVSLIKTAHPDILFVGLGAGRQERWLDRHLTELNVPVAMTIGGSLDVLSGAKKRAPRWIRAMSIEWLYRLLTEPQRWTRQLALPRFLLLMCQQGINKYEQRY